MNNGWTLTMSRRPKPKPKQKVTIVNKHLILSYKSGATKEWFLPSPSQKREIRIILGEAKSFARQNGATQGQAKVIEMTLIQGGYLKLVPSGHSVRASSGGLPGLGKRR